MIQKIKDYYTKYREIIVYLIVGVLTTIVSWLTYAVCTLFMDVDNPLIMQVAVIIRWTAGVAFAYVTNRAFVFQSKNPSIVKELTSFVSARLVTLGMEMFVMWLLASMCHMDDWVATFICAVLVTITNYILSKFIVFKKKKSE